MTRYSYSRYLSSKKTVDDRALNRHVVGCLGEALARRRSAEPLRILEIGAGLGTMVARMVDWQLITHADYVLLDSDATSLANSRGWLIEWAHRGNHSVTATMDGLTVHTSAGGRVVVSTVHATLEAFLDVPTPRSGAADILVANAFLDLVDVPYYLPQLFARIAPEGLFWFSINFDGETIFTPAHPSDAQLLAVYHRSMDERVRDGRRAGDSHCGRHLFAHLRDAGADILAAGASDWVVFSHGGKYHEDEAYFLQSIVHTIDEELSRWPQVDPRVLREWVDTRMSQITSGELTYLAHQLDFVGRPGAPA